MENKLKNKNLWILLIIGVSLYFFANFQRIAIPGAIFDVLQSELSINAPFVTAFGAIFMYVYAITQLVNGILVDRIGGFRVILIGALIFTAGNLIFPLTSNVSLMYFSRALTGIGASMFYLSLIKVLGETFSDKNFGIAMSVMLCIGYCGAIAANAPFVFAIEHIGWRNALLFLSAVTTIGAFIFWLILRKIELPAINKNVKLRTLPFKLVLHKKHNRNLFSFACCNFGIYYTIQAIIGKKFLEDFCLLQVNKAAFVLSLMAVIAAVFNIVNASMCKLCHNHRVLFLKGASLVTFATLSFICLSLYFNYRNIGIAIAFFILAANASLSSLLVPVLRLTNLKAVSSTAVSVMNFCFFTMVGILGSLTGFLLNVFEPAYHDGVCVYSTSSYLLVFGLFLLLSIFEMYKAMKLSDKY